ncbi:MAG: hypothetical protein WB524_10475 [Acidobacteriaceae bacterium]
MSTTRDAAELPVRRVVLYKNGIGYFEHAGRITGNQAVTIDFTSSQLDDALQSLTALDLGGGRITGVGYNSTTPLEQQLKNIPLGLGEKPSTTQLYAAIEGARVEVSGAGENALSGRIVHYEIRSEKTAAGGIANHRVLTVVTDAGAIRSLEVTPATSVRILDGDVRHDLDDYLTLLASTQSRQMRHLTLSAQGTGARDIRVSYISEVPVWKSTYRIVFSGSSQSSAEPETATLQGWAVVDNTVGSDWDNVQLSLVAGAPQSFIEPLSQPIYTHRPEVAVPEAANIAPTIHEGAIDSNGPLTDGAMINGAAAVAKMQARAQVPSQNQNWVGAEAMAGGGGGGVAAGVTGGIAPGRGGGYGGGIYHPGGGTLQDESASASSAKFDDYFEYTLAQPVTIHKNESALVPVLQTNVLAEHVTLYNATNAVPLRALWLTNSGNETLDRGSFSIFENGEFAGEGLTDTIHAGEKRLLSYAVDQAVRVSTEGHLNSTHLRHITVHDGYLTERTEEIREVTYVVHNAATDARTVLVEHPVQNGWKLTSEVKPAETTPSFYRFTVAMQPGETARLHVGEAQMLGQRYQLTAIEDDQLQVIVNGGGNRAAVEQALAPVLAARARVHDLDTQIEGKQKDIDRRTEDQKRLHNNLAGLKDSPEERALARRYAGEMNTDEDQLQWLKKDQGDLEAQRKQAQQTLDETIRNLSIDLDV